MIPKKIADNTHYRITLKARADVRGADRMITLHPGNAYTVRGDVLKTIKDKVHDAQAI